MLEAITRRGMLGSTAGLALASLLPEENKIVYQYRVEVIYRNEDSYFSNYFSLLGKALSALHELREHSKPRTIFWDYYLLEWRKVNCFEFREFVEKIINSNDPELGHFITSADVMDMIVRKI